MLALSAHNLKKSYFRAGLEIPVLKDLTIEVRASESVAVVGASGIGKSTLLHCCGLLDSPDSGSLEIGGKGCLKMNEIERAKTRQEMIGFVFQFHYLMTELTALENVMLPLMIAQKTKSECRDAAAEWLSKLGLEHRMEHQPAQLSGGEQQRVAIARALVSRPKIILADEPTGNLDPETANRIFDLLLERAQELNAGLLMATHNLELASRLDRQLELKEGRV